MGRVAGRAGRVTSGMVMADRLVRRQGGVGDKQNYGGWRVNRIRRRRSVGDKVEAAHIFLADRLTEAIIRIGVPIKTIDGLRGLAKRSLVRTEFARKFYCWNSVEIHLVKFEILRLLL